MAVKNLKKKPVFIWIPPPNSAIYKITVERGDGTVDDITNIIVDSEIEDGVTNQIGRFEFSVYDVDGTYKSIWTGMEIFRFYADYTSPATTLRFRGRIEKVSYNNYLVKVTGRTESLKLMEITVTKSYSNQECSVILKDLLSSYSSYTSTNTLVTPIQKTVNWFQKPFWDCVKELCTACGYDAYLDCNNDFHFFPASSVTNSTDAIVHTYNLTDTDEFADDLTFVKNRIRVYGATVDGIQLIHTAEDLPSQTSYGLREEIVNDDNITEYAQITEYADYLLAQKKVAPKVGSVTGIMIPTIQPGEMIYISDPMNNIPPNKYSTANYVHTISSSDGLKTKVSINKEPRTFSAIVNSMIDRDYQKSDNSKNPNEMSYTYNFTFDTDEGTHTNTQITGGILKATVAAGYWVSPTRNEGSNVTSVYLIVNSDLITGVTFYVSGNNGVNYDLITPNTLTTLSTSTGTNLIIKAVFTDTVTEVKSLSLQYKY